MSNFDGEIDPPAGWADVPQLSTEALAMGGPDGPINAQAVALAARTKHLLENMADASAVEAAAEKADTALSAAGIANDTASSALNTAQAAESLADGAFDAATNALGMVQLVGGMKNRIINGKMEIAQRGVSFPVATGGQYFADRFVLLKAGTTAAVTISKVTFGPNTEFRNCIRLEVTTADTTMQPTDVCSINQALEGHAISDLVGKDFVLSFWVRASKAGTYCVSFRNSATDKAYVAEYTITQPNVFEFKTIVVRGGLDPTGTWNIDETVGVRLGWSVAIGANFRAGIHESWVNSNSVSTDNQVNLLDTTGANFYLTGVQLERGVVATAFDQRPRAVELSLCQRFFEIMYSVFHTSTLYSQSYWKVTKRAPPTLTVIMVVGAVGPTYTVPNGESLDMVYQSVIPGPGANQSGMVTISGNSEL